MAKLKLSLVFMFLFMLLFNANVFSANIYQSTSNNQRAEIIQLQNEYQREVFYTTMRFTPLTDSYTSLWSSIFTYMREETVIFITLENKDVSAYDVRLQLTYFALGNQSYVTDSSRVITIPPNSEPVVVAITSQIDGEAIIMDLKCESDVICPNLWTYTAYQVRAENELNSILSTMVNSVVALIDLNLFIWNLLIWVLSFSFVIFLIFSTINMLIGFMRKLRELKESTSNHRVRGQYRDRDGD